MQNRQIKCWMDNSGSRKTTGVRKQHVQKRNYGRRTKILMELKDALIVRAEGICTVHSNNS